MVFITKTQNNPYNTHSVLCWDESHKLRKENDPESKKFFFSFFPNIFFSLSYSHYSQHKPVQKY